LTPAKTTPSEAVLRPRFLAERSGHHVQIEQPALGIAAIGDVLKTVQQK
jgi:hypothetical protein